MASTLCASGSLLQWRKEHTSAGGADPGHASTKGAPLVRHRRKARVPGRVRPHLLYAMARAGAAPRDS
eukprot:1138218-Lingulodinium_polyedra.AAC.1